MRVLAIITSYNEINYLPYVVEYYLHIGVDVFILDNYSTDGTLEWVKKSGLPYEMVDTNNTFHLEKLQEARLAVMHREKPDWVIYGDADEYAYSQPYLLPRTIQVADQSGCNIIRCAKFEVYYTGEERKKGDPRKLYFYGLMNTVEMGGIMRMHKYDLSVSYEGDYIHMENRVEGKGPFCVINYGGTKDKENREDVFGRMKGAWEEGLPRLFGNHYQGHQNQNWTWDKNKLLDMRENDLLNRFINEEIPSISSRTDYTK